ncbi:hypothetical protein X474_21450 [Dethiosulfatarculus sandiegensis]|uniref:Uncharacterized protein n=1 Tax=Dethiosulfatarculus sandiegensis TaxID=1429043 RepID=A0A0D2JR81_9BACT|nr:hypothetical protein X474_21450 [Dethiosulfatarculus sandiegensis]
MFFIFPVPPKNFIRKQLFIHLTMLVSIIYTHKKGRPPLKDGLPV